jgi:hypothetical protein
VNGPFLFLGLVPFETIAAPVAFIGMADQWTEQLRCPMCSKAGNALLSQGDDEETPSAISVPDGFEVVQRKYSIDFICSSCRIPVEP